jgi:hypothetical protein
MGVLLFSNDDNKSEKKLVRAINGIAKRHTQEIFHSIGSISNRFRQPQKDLDLMVILAGSRGDLINLLAIKELFFPIPLILIVPDGEPETMKIGFKLLPRFVSFKNGSFRDVRSVMKKMLDEIERRDRNGKYCDS